MTWRLLATFTGPELRPGAWAYRQHLQRRHGFAGMSEYRLSIVTRSTARVVEFKRGHKDFTRQLAAVEATA